MDKSKYKMVYRPNHPKTNQTGQIYEHIDVMEKHLNRYLTDKEVIHHIDNNGRNNDISNLKLCKDYKEHKNQHYPDINNRICLKCGTKETKMALKDGKYKVSRWAKYKDGFICFQCYDEMYRLNKKDLKYKLQIDLLKQFIDKKYYKFCRIYD